MELIGASALRLHKMQQTDRQRALRDGLTRAYTSSYQSLAKGEQRCLSQIKTF